MLIECDAKGLEWVTVAYLSNDQIAIHEIRTKVDQHTENQKRFNFPERVIAKKFVFRLIYGGSAWSYAHDPEFIPVSRNEKFWQSVIDKFYEKYQDIYKWHTHIMQETKLTGMLAIPTGRIYRFGPTNRGGDLEWPRTKILNYPVQGLAADIMVVLRVAFARKFIESGIPGKLVSTVHDSIVVDVEEEYVEATCKLFEETFYEGDRYLKEYFNIDFPVKLECEIKYGRNLKDTQIWVPS